MIYKNLNNLHKLLFTTKTKKDTKKEEKIIILLSSFFDAFTRCLWLLLNFENSRIRENGFRVENLVRENKSSRKSRRWFFLLFFQLFLDFNDN